MAPTTPLDLYYAGQLQDAITASLEVVKQRPTDQGARVFLCEMLCFAGDLERADRQLETLTHQDPGSALEFAVFRQLIRAEQARQQFYSEGHLPEFLDSPEPRLRLHLEASICLREQKGEEAARLLDQAEEQRPKLTGMCNGQPFEGLRDPNDLTASFFEILTKNGKYYWIPMERMESLEFRPHHHPRDLLWRRAQMVVRDGPEAEVCLPALYPGAHAEEDDRVRLGRRTEDRGGEGLPVQVVGQREFLVGEDYRPIMELQTLTINAPDRGS